MQNVVRSGLLAIALLALVPAGVMAHAVHVVGTLRTGKVEVETFYDDDTPAIKAKVEVLNAREEIVVSGVTDDKGRWTFDTPPPGKYEVRLDAGAGHRAKCTITVPGIAQTQTEPEGPTREEITRTPWLKVAIGFVVIGGCAGAFLIATLIRKNGKP